MTPKTKIVTLPRKNNVPNSTPAATFRMNLQNPFLSGEDLQQVYKNLFNDQFLAPQPCSIWKQPTKTVHPSQSSRQPHHQGSEFSTEVYRQRKPRIIKLSRSHMATSLKEHRPWRYSQPKTRALVVPCYHRANLEDEIYF